MAVTASPFDTVITVSSGAATNPLEGWSSYCAGKAGALMLIAWLAVVVAIEVMKMVLKVI